MKKHIFSIFRDFFKVLKIDDDLSFLAKFVEKPFSKSH
jgi:hypothetical protein